MWSRGEENDNAERVNQTAMKNNLFYDRSILLAVKVRQKQCITADLLFYFEPC
jgi:hypothetical protein